MMLLKYMKVCRLCGKEKQQGTDVFKDKSKGSVLISIINKYFSKEVINICINDDFSKYVCIDCEQKICMFDEFCLMVANVQKTIMAPTLEIDFAEDMLCHLKQSDLNEKSVQEQMDLNLQKKKKCICLTCGKGFRCQAHLERHERIHTGQRPFVCNICQMSFNQREILTKHKECHEGKKQFQCANCHQSFRYKVSLKSHMINFHTDVDQSMIPNQTPCMQQQLVCSECGKIFATNYKLERHARSHTGEKPFRCNFCDRSFSQTANLKLHQLKCHQIFSQMLNHPHQSQSQSIASGASVSLNTFQSMYIFDNEIQKTINETINSTDAGSSYLNKSYDNSIYIDDDIEKMLDHDLNQLERQKYANSSQEVLTSHQEKISLCLKQPELLHSLLDDLN